MNDYKWIAIFGVGIVTATVLGISVDAWKQVEIAKIEAQKNCRTLIDKEDQ